MRPTTVVSSTYLMKWLILNRHGSPGSSRRIKANPVHPPAAHHVLSTEAPGGYPAQPLHNPQTAISLADQAAPEHPLFPVDSHT
ncbi:hypothetical protein ILYODFUR_006389 [Ilyodon furcidens]|uniref:Uncharacterized protein n=1 Tax=Ilyodon furcidens TaxID=33524 RepID=A0ABV0T5T3_9TELE